MQVKSLRQHIVLAAVVLLGLLLASGIGFVAANSSFFFSNSIFPGIEAAGVSVGGLSVEEATAAIEKQLANQLKDPILTVQYEGKKWTIYDKNLALIVHPHRLALQAYAIGRTGNLLQQLQDRYAASNQGLTLSLQQEYDEAKLRQLFQQIAAEINRPSHNARVDIHGKNRTLTPEEHGRAVDETAALQKAKQVLESGLGKNMSLPVLVKAATVTANDLKDVVDVLASYTTTFGLGDSNRVFNVTLAANTLDEAFVRPGEVFSYNQQIGERTASAGYKQAPAYIGDELVPDIGGGICQVSTTLYNAALLADQAIVERSTHIHPVSYAPLGQDATVADGVLDFKFKNSLRYPIYIRTFLSGNRLTVEIYGKRTPDMPDIEIISDNVKIIEPKTIVKQDPNMPLGQQKVEREGQTGYEVTTYRIRSRSNQSLGRELLGNDEYPVTDKILIVGAKVPEAEKKLQKP